jgi:hypothetical protein
VRGFDDEEVREKDDAPKSMASSKTFKHIKTFEDVKNYSCF